MEHLGTISFQAQPSKGGKECVQEAHGEAPDFQIQRRSEEFPDGKGLRLDVATISFNTVDDELDLPLTEEIP